MGAPERQVPTMTTKERAVRIISQLPAEVTVEDIMDELYTQMKIEKGLRQLDAGQGIEHAEVKRRLGKWLNK